jgi:membrane-associated phospholipid phosphatase
MGAGQAEARRFWWAALAFAALAAAGLLWLDGPLARWTAAAPARFWGQGTDLLDLVTLHQLSDFLIGGVLIVLGAGLAALRSTRHAGWPILYVGAVQLGATLAADLAKPQFGRLRPLQAMADPGGGDLWFVGANSFPSGHAAFYAGLFLPLILIVPRWAPLWALPVLFIAVARMLVHAHYLSDVAASLALACALTAALSFIARKR